jgi:hypothetical protein
LSTQQERLQEIERSGKYQKAPEGPKLIRLRDKLGNVTEHYPVDCREILSQEGCQYECADPEGRALLFPNEADNA